MRISTGMNKKFVVEIIKQRSITLIKWAIYMYQNKPAGLNKESWIAVRFWFIASEGRKERHFTVYTIYMYSGKKVIVRLGTFQNTWDSNIITETV